ncbi:MAG: type II toxin-antitoxin system RelE/ParE family toxin, partial [Psychrosphaera sp.]|nr:type II toxin-antitoxin system RelE/ParE family toxin [Psychrosphaera sp.]
IITYTPEAINDLNRLNRFLATKKTAVAKKAIGAILRGISQLKTYPLLGVQVQQASNPQMIRDLIIGDYIIRYLVTAKEVTILRTWHHKENRD